MGGGGVFWWLSGKESACNTGSCRRCRFDPWVRKIPWRRAWQPTPVFLPGWLKFSILPCVFKLFAEAHYIY